MSRPARLAAVPEPSPESDREPERLLTLAQLADHLQVSRTKVEADVRAGMPHLDVGTHRAGRRLKRSLRFNRAKVEAWYEGRR